MAINNFIPTVWSETLFEELEKEYIGVRNCNRDFEGDIKAKGDSVNIVGVGAVTVFDYTKNTDMSSPETLTDSTRTLSINQAKGFNFQIDDIDHAQQVPKIMSAAMRGAASALANAADSYIYSLYTQVSEGNTIPKSGVAYTDIIDLLLSARQLLEEGNVPASCETVLEVDPAVASLLLKSKLLSSSSNEESVEAGYIGNFVGFKVYTPNNIATATSTTDSKLYHKCYARTKRAIAFAEQISEIEAYRPEARFADAVKGLHLYGAKVVYPKEIVLLDLNLAS